MPALIVFLLLQDAAEIEQLLSSDDAAARKRGIEALSRLKGSEKDRVAGKVLDQEKSEYDKAVDELKNLVDGKSARKAFEDWEKQQEKALAAVMNTGSFPDPRPTDKIRGPYKGFDKVDAAMKKLEAAYAEAAKVVDALQPSAASKKLGELAQRIKELGDALGKSVELRPWSDAFWDAAQKFEAGELGAKVDPAMTPTQRHMLFFLYCRAFIKAELAADNGMTDKEKEAVQGINRLRMMLGIAPLEGDARLAKAIKGHIEDMEKNGYFGHFEKNENSKTPQQRCQAQGYKATTGEDIASTPEPDKSIEMWRWDGGHFRNMINPGYVQIGLAIGKSACGFDVGSGDGARRPRFDLSGK
jgi:uncharacterized protein YkwD